MGIHLLSTAGIWSDHIPAMDPVSGPRNGTSNGNLYRDTVLEPVSGHSIEAGDERLEKQRLNEWTAEVDRNAF
jgi:hypothetical protein